MFVLASSLLTLLLPSLQETDPELGN
eukprot:COSAG01_NODE_15287_length_1354_cov_1.249402_2_plen_25_part_01